MTHFLHVHLRTLGTEAARAFYAAVLGAHELRIYQLHEQAVARGARPHWLGYLAVDDVDAAADKFVQRGASLFTKWKSPEGLEAAVMRDPGGAIVALGREETPRTPSIEPAWSVLNTPDVERAKATYTELFGLHFRAPFELGGLGTFHPFAWSADAEPVGVFADVAQRPGVHPHWLYHFHVADMDRAVAAVHEHGGVVIGPSTLPDGRRVAACDDPQGAAFALMSPA
jgi:hypothetical protein